MAAQFLLAVEANALCRGYACAGLLGFGQKFLYRIGGLVTTQIAACIVYAPHITYDQRPNGRSFFYNPSLDIASLVAC
jgi:hypothetical protein